MRSVPTRVCGQQGFTLIEIIAVVIIIGILATVAVPKFFAMSDQARTAAVDGALSEAVTRFNHAYTRFILDEKRAPTGVAELYLPKYLGADAGVSGTGESIGDFNVSWRAHGTEEDTVVIFVESSSAVSGLDSLADAVRTQELSGIVWSSAP